MAFRQQQGWHFANSKDGISPTARMVFRQQQGWHFANSKDGISPFARMAFRHSRGWHFANCHPERSRGTATIAPLQEVTITIT
jgi:hypothetical protein